MSLEALCAISLDSLGGKSWIVIAILAVLALFILIKFGGKILKFIFIVAILAAIVVAVLYFMGMDVSKIVDPIKDIFAKIKK